MKPEQIAAQLYTCRALTKNPKDIAATMHRLREVGYRAVQVSAMGPIPEEELNRILDGEGMVCCATHEPPDQILDEPSRVIERLKKLRCTITAYPAPKGIDLGDEAVVKAWIAKLDAAGAAMAAEGISLCYHNHNHEFRKLGGKIILDQIFSGTKSNHLQAELDTYWVHYGGGENVALCESLAGRMPAIHLKDYATNSESKPEYCEIGAGNLDFKKIITAAENSGCQWFIVEQDVCPGDPVDSLAQSFRYLTENLTS